MWRKIFDSPSCQIKINQFKLVNTDLSNSVHFQRPRIVPEPETRPEKEMVQQENSLNLKGILYHYGVRNIPICEVSVATMIHEYGHLLCSKILGFNCYIKSDAPSSVYHLAKPVGSQWTPFYLSGGLLQFLVLGLMSLQANDQGAKIANRMTAMIGLIEALVEPMQSLRLSGLGATMGIILAFLYLAYEAQRYKSI